MAGIFISKGMKVGVPAGGLVVRIGEDGRPSASLELHVHFDVCPTWLELARKHLSDAKACAQERKAAWKGKDESAKAATLEREFESSMQSIMAAAIAVDAFYAMVQKRVEVPDALRKTWREKRTARHAQIAEVLRVAFGIQEKGFMGLKQNLKEIYRMRDAAVHPPGDLKEAILHPELGVGVEWRFAYFRYENAAMVEAAARQIVTELTASGKPKTPALAEYAKALTALIEGERTKGSDDGTSPGASEGKSCDQG